MSAERIKSLSRRRLKTLWGQLFSPIAKLLAHLRRRPPATMGIVFGSNGFTNPARESVLLSGTSQVLFWDGDEVDWAFERRGRFSEGLLKKYRQAVMTGLPDFHLRTGAP